MEDATKDAIIRLNKQAREWIKAHPAKLMPSGDIEVDYPEGSHWTLKEKIRRLAVLACGPRCERLISKNEFSQLGGRPISRPQGYEICNVPPCKVCGGRMWFIGELDPYQSKHLYWGDMGDYLLFVCTDCFRRGTEGTYYVTGTCM
ncbi:MAG: hypothetical protein K2Y21_12545 [Phycisphaerales bacterium]|nr:hypothetical protein [Phycisphaerales bacterium]